MLAQRCGSLLARSAQQLAARDALACGSVATMRRGVHQQPIARERPQNVGILALEVYFPQRCVAQKDLEVADGVSEGKYRIGLGQERMAFVGDREDVNSIMMTAAHNLLSKYNVSPDQVGRLEVGTETLIDKSKSSKTHLMELFGSNTNIEGVTSINACYGGTASILNSVAWIESSAWDGRYAMVVCGDIAVYAEGPARPTGGAGAVAMLVGPDAPMPLSHERHSHAEHCWDFYKPEMHSEYPAVDGHLSNTVYLRSVDVCYNNFLQKTTPDGTVGTFDYMCFHSPYNKLVVKSVGRLLYNDYVRNPSGCAPELREALSAWHPDSVPPASTYADRGLDGALKKLSAPVYKAKCQPSASLSKELGNSYTGALWVNLVSLVDSIVRARASGRAGAARRAAPAACILAAREPRARRAASEALTTSRPRHAPRARALARARPCVCAPRRGAGLWTSASSCSPMARARSRRPSACTRANRRLRRTRSSRAMAWRRPSTCRRASPRARCRRLQSSAPRCCYARRRTAQRRTCRLTRWRQSRRARTTSMRSTRNTTACTSSAPRRTRCAAPRMRARTATRCARADRAAHARCACARGSARRRMSRPRRPTEIEGRPAVPNRPRASDGCSRGLRFGHRAKARDASITDFHPRSGRAW